MLLHVTVLKGGKKEFVADINVTSHVQLESASPCGYPQYTNYVPSFSGCLDYIYFSEWSGLKLKRVIPLASHEKVVENTALPNADFPSDHLPLVCEFQVE